MTHIPPHEAVAMLPHTDTVRIAWRLSPDAALLSGDIETATVRDDVDCRGAFAVDDPDLLREGYTMRVDLGWSDVYVQCGEVQP